MAEFVYYEDENVAVTDQSVKLGEKVYALKDVRFVGVVPHLPQPITGNARTGRRVLFAFLYILSYFALIFLILALLPPSPVTMPIYLLFPIVAALLNRYSSSRRPYQGLLSIRLPGGFGTTFPSTDKKYLERIAKTINAAVIEDRKAKKLKRPNSGMIRS